MSDFAGMEDLLQDFLVEAGDLLSGVDNKLVDLERSPDDRGLLNDIFRGFHTIKGGAGFLNATELVTLCHLTESLFDRGIASAEERAVALAYIRQLDEAGLLGRPIVTTVEDLDRFYPAEDYHQDYFRKHPDHPYIRAWFPAKEKKLRAHLRALLRPEAR